MDYIKTNITHHNYVQFWWHEWKINGLKLKALKDTIQKVTKVSPRQTVLLSVWIIINPQTKTKQNPVVSMNIKKRWQTSHHLIFKANELVVGASLDLFTSRNRTRTTSNDSILQNVKVCFKVPIFNRSDTGCNQKAISFLEKKLNSSTYM